MDHILCLGEASVEYIAEEKGIKISNASHFDTRIGGEAALCLEFASIGKASALLSKVGNEHFGETIRETLDKGDVDTSALLTDATYNTAVSFISLNNDGSIYEKNYVTHGADLNLQENEITLRALENVSLLHSSSYGILSYNRHYLRLILLWARKKGIRTSFKLQEELLINKETRNILINLLPFIDILILSVKQANLLTGLLSTDFTSEKLMHDFLFEKVLIYDDNRVHLYTAEKHQEMKMDYKARKKFEALFLSAIAEGKDDSLLSVAQNVQLF